MSPSTPKKGSKLPVKVRPAGEAKPEPSFALLTALAAVQGMGKVRH